MKVIAIQHKIQQKVDEDSLPSGTMINPSGIKILNEENNNDDEKIENGKMSSPSSSPTSTIFHKSPPKDKEVEPMSLEPSALTVSNKKRQRRWKYMP